MDLHERLEPPTAITRPDTPKWYSRTAVDEFHAAAAAERARLESVIADAGARLARAKAAVGLDRTMAEMLLDGQRQIEEIRRAAEVEAAAILAGAPAPGAAGGPVADGDDPGAGVGLDPDASLEPLSPNDDDFFARLKGSLGGPEGRGSLDDD
jgi:hypothetical protein